MKNTISKGWLSLLIVMGILILDQIIKIAVKTNMYYNESIRITDWFYIHFVENPGMAFGMQVIPKAVQTIGRILFVFPRYWQVQLEILLIVFFMESYSVKVPYLKWQLLYR